MKSVKPIRRGERDLQLVHRHDRVFVTAGGRVLCATAIGRTVEEAQQQAYRLAEKIRWNGMFHRNDIGYRAIARERGED